METSVVSILLVVLSSVIGAFGGFVFKQSTKNLKFSFDGLIRNWRLVLGFFLFGIASITYIIALKGGDLNVLYPISSLTYVWSAFIARKHLEENINLFKVIGIFLIVLGSVVIVS